MSRFQYKPNVRTIRLLCTGQVEPIYILEALLRGADGILIGGCHLGDCRYGEGNYHAFWKVNVIKMILKQAGIEEERVRMEFMSSAEAERYVNIVSDFIQTIKKIGPTPVLNDEQKEEIKRRLKAVESALNSFRMRAWMGKYRKLVEKGNVYGDKFSEEEMKNLVKEVIYAENIRHQILLLAKERPRSCKELAEITGIEPKEVLKHLIFLRRRNLVDVEKIEGRSPLYKTDPSAPIGI